MEMEISLKNVPTDEQSVKKGEHLGMFQVLHIV